MKKLMVMIAFFLDAYGFWLLLGLTTFCSVAGIYTFDRMNRQILTERSEHETALANAKAKLAESEAKGNSLASEYKKKETKLASDYKKTEEALKSLKTLMDDNGPIYQKLGQATVQVSADGSKCHGVLLKFNGRVIMNTAAHCLINHDTGKRTCGKFKLSDYLSEPWSNAAQGYGFLDNSKWDYAFSADQVILKKGYDMAFVILPKNKAFADRAISLSNATPQPMHAILSTRWQDYSWAINGKFQNGELIGPSIGIAEDYGEPRNFFKFTLTAFPGDSGSGIVNTQGDLVGIVNNGAPDKAGGEGSKINGLGPRSIRSFLERAWPKNSKNKT